MFFSGISSPLSLPPLPPSPPPSPLVVVAAAVVVVVVAVAVVEPRGASPPLSLFPSLPPLSLPLLTPSRRRYADLAGWIRLLSHQDPELYYPRGANIGGWG